MSKSQFWPDMVFENCSDSYPGPEIVLRDETGLPDSPPILDLVGVVKLMKFMVLIQN